jgi:hypothetical protein
MEEEDCDANWSDKADDGVVRRSEHVAAGS